MRLTHDPVRTVAVLGAGAIGSAVARAFLRGGLDVTVWNRTTDRARPLADEGAALAETVAGAARAELLVLSLTDGRAVLDVLAQATDDLADRIVAALGTVTPHDAEVAAEVVGRAGGTYLGIGLQHGPDEIGTPAVGLPVGGAADAFHRASPVLGLLGTPRHVGSAPSAAAVWDLALFGVWYDAQLGLLRALDAARVAGIDVTDFAQAAQAQLEHAVDATKATAEELATGAYPPGPADLGQHAPVLEALIGLRDGARLGDGGLEHVRRLLGRKIEEGWGDSGLSALVA
jgi:3-hydroxyisobutyrate dehydrogenase-like beta-hydroxyacid dehydrogenase